MTLSDNPIGASYLYLLEPEIRFLEAAVEHLIPTDELGPGARDAGVVVYIDRQLAGSWGTHGRMYRGGPWMDLYAGSWPFSGLPCVPILLPSTEPAARRAYRGRSGQNHLTSGQLQEHK